MNNDIEEQIKVEKLNLGELYYYQDKNFHTANLLHNTIFYFQTIDSDENEYICKCKKDDNPHFCQTCDFNNLSCTCIDCDCIILDKIQL